MRYFRLLNQLKSDSNTFKTFTDSNQKMTFIDYYSYASLIHNEIRPDTFWTEFQNFGHSN